MIMERYILLTAAILSTLLDTSIGEMFTAVTHMEELVELEGDLLHGLNAYIAAEKQRLAYLERFSKQVKTALDAADIGISQHLHDPVNAFQLVNRYSNGWMKLHNKVYQDNAQDLMANISLNRYRFPTKEDFDGAIAALRRLQDTYKISPSKIAKGKLGSHNGLAMSSMDCFIVGRVAYNEKDWKHTRQWMLASLEKFDEEDTATSEVDIPSIYDHLAFSEYSLGNIKRAAQYNREVLQHDQFHERALANRDYFEKISREDPDRFVDGEEDDAEETESDKYEKLCREPIPQPSDTHKDLICYYFDNNRNPRLLLRPIKTEIMFLKPPIWLYYDIVSDEEIDRLKVLAKPKLQRATARNGATGKFEPVDYRISKSCVHPLEGFQRNASRLNRATVHGTNGELIHATYRISKSGWLSASDDDQGYVTRIDQRIEDITGLTMSTAEQLQVVNYGIGGHYEPHYDFARTGEDAFSSLGSGNRISTLLIYLSDVELGGATVFPLVGARIPPIKGAAAYWWNLNKSGNGDYSTRHAGCPVLVGSKWVCNKWIHERGQEFRRPCGLSVNE